MFACFLWQRRGSVWPLWLLIDVGCWWMRMTSHLRDPSQFCLPPSCLLSPLERWLPGWHVLWEPPPHQWWRKYQLGFCCGARFVVLFHPVGVVLSITLLTLKSSSALLLSWVFLLSIFIILLAVVFWVPVCFNSATQGSPVTHAKEREKVLRNYRAVPRCYGKHIVLLLQKNINSCRIKKKTSWEALGCVYVCAVLYAWLTDSLLSTALSAFFNS